MMQANLQIIFLDENIRILILVTVTAIAWINAKQNPWCHMVSQSAMN